jgi:hypothetical protein
MMARGDVNPSSIAPCPTEGFQPHRLSDNVKRLRAANGMAEAKEADLGGDDGKAHICAKHQCIRHEQAEERLSTTLYFHLT